VSEKDRKIEPMATDPPKLTPDEIELAADRFKVLSDRTRLAILQVLRKGECTVNRVAELVGASQPTISKHLATLTRSGMVKRRQDGNRVLCSIADPIVFRLCDLVCGELGSGGCGGKS
jgi:DNA-binding transcriptional ArsR family regulator